MKFHEKHLNKHHLLHAPHKWFLAFLTSPIHFCIIHYKKRYHLRFIHAKKLFFFDISLLLSAIIIAAGALFWFTYDPTITDLVYLNITPDQERIESGNIASYTITFENNSDTSLVDPTIGLQLPPGFSLQKIEPSSQFSKQTNSFTFPNIPAGGSGNATISGRFFGDVGKEYPILATLSYKQETRDQREEKRATVLATLPDSTLKIRITSPTESTGPSALLAQGQSPVIFNIKNTNDIALNNVILSLPQTEQLQVTTAEENNEINIEELQPNQEVIIPATITTNIQERQEETTLVFTPTIDVDAQTFTQKIINYPVAILYPAITAEANWEAKSTQPNTTNNLNITLTNNGTTLLENMRISFPVNNTIINASALAANIGRVTNQTFSIDTTHLANLQTLPKESTKSITIPIPITPFPTGGTDLRLSLPITIEANVTGLPSATFSKTLTSANTNIGTWLRPTAESRYYTSEGDQLGRGPLPPQVGKETKYWALINIANGPSQIHNLQLKASLPNHVTWTGKTSVSHGQDASFNPQTRQVSWQPGTLGAYEKAGVYIELSITPTAQDKGNIIQLLNNSTISGTDSYTGNTLTKTLPNLDTSVPNDAIAKTKGILVQ